MAEQPPFTDLTGSADDVEPAPPRRRRRFRHPVGLVVTLSLVLVAALSATGVTFAYDHLNGNLGHHKFARQQPAGYQAPKVKQFPDSPEKPLNILIMGDDSRDCEGCHIDNEIGGGSDTTILLHLSRDREHAYAVSIPRDLMVDRPECVGKDGADSTTPAETYVQWNEAYDIGGPSCTILQTQSLSHVFIDDSIVVNFQGFKDMVEAVGGVEVCVPEDIDDSQYHIHIPAGTRVIDGNEALAYVRERHGVGDGSDLGRIKRQQAFIASMAKAVLSARTLTSPIKVYRFLNAATKNLEVEDNLANLKDLASLGYGFRHIKPDQIKFFTIPIATDPQNPNRVVLAPEAADIFKDLKNDRVIPNRYLDGSSISVNKVPGQTKKNTKRNADKVATENQALEYAGLCTI